VVVDRVSRRAACRFSLFVVLLVATGAVAFWRARHGLPLTVEAVRASIAAWGPLAPLIFIAAWVLRPFLFFPTVLLFVGGGLAFGALWGTLYSAVGGTLSGIVTFGLARALGREFVQARIRDRFPQLHEERWGAGLVFVLNLIPIVPVTAINYGAGLSRISLGGYTLAVMAGLTPRAFAYSFFGSSILNVHTPKFAAAIGLLLVLIVVPTVARKWLTRGALKSELKA
jgi:uncharacterized membrane protein YdjX (TVP38/TMEM64 family)